MSQNNSNKLWVLAGAALVAGAAFLVLNDDAREGAKALVNRERAKLYVRNHLGGSDAIISAIDHLPDREVNAILAMANGASKGANRAYNKGSDVFNAIVDRARDLGDDVADAVNDWIN